MLGGRIVSAGGFQLSNRLTGGRGCVGGLMSCGCLDDGGADVRQRVVHRFGGISRYRSLKNLKESI